MTAALPWHEPVMLRLLAQRERLPHALLLHGRRGTGKVRFAVALAHALLCENPVPAGACGACPACIWLNSSSHPDFRRLEPAAAGEDPDQPEARTKASSQIVIEQVRELSDFLFVATHRGGWRVVVVTPAEALNSSAANALLKNLEEPPDRTLFLLVSHRLHQLLPTIKSRCQLLPLPAPGADEAARWLKEEGIGDSALAAAYTGRAPLLAAELSSDEYWAQRKQFLARLDAGKPDSLGIAQSFHHVGIPVLLEWMQKWTYDLAALTLVGAVRYNVDQEAVLARLASVCEPRSILRYHRSLLLMQRHAEHPLNARLFLEQLMMSYADAIRPVQAAA